MEKVYSKSFFLILLLLVAGCGVNYQFKTVERLKNEGAYQEAIIKYKNIVDKYPTSELSFETDDCSI